jgi:hypothetical protein
MTRRDYRLTPLPPPFRTVLDDRVPLDRRLERELRVREFARKVTVAAVLLAVGGLGAIVAGGVAVALRWWGR